MPRSGVRRILIVCVLVAASDAVASPATWADWVGDYRGAVTWRSCTAPGERTVTLGVDAIDGAMQIDLAPAGAGLRALSLTPEDAAWVAQDGDITVKVARGKPNTLVLAVDFESGCRVRGKLARVTPAVPACARLVAWSRIEARCTKTTAKLEDPAALAKKWKPADAASCTARGDKLERAMIDAGCAPHPDPDIGTRAVECRVLADATAKLARCGRVPREIMQRRSAIASALSSAAQSAEPSALTYVTRQCKDERSELAAIATQFSCQL